MTNFLINKGLRKYIKFKSKTNLIKSHIRL